MSSRSWGWAVSWLRLFGYWDWLATTPSSVHGNRCRNAVGRSHCIGPTDIMELPRRTNDCYVCTIGVSPSFWWEALGHGSKCDTRKTSRRGGSERVVPAANSRFAYCAACALHQGGWRTATMNPIIEYLKQTEGTVFVNEDGYKDDFKLRPPLSERELSAFEAGLPCALPAEMRSEEH